MPAPHRRLAALLTLLGVAGLIVLVILTRPEKRLEMTPPPPARVETLVVTRHDFRPTERVGGRLLPWRTARLAFETGGRVVERRVEPGQRMRKDDLLVRIDAREAEAALADAEAQLALERARIERDRKRLALAREEAKLQTREVERLASLGDEALVSATRRESARSRLLQLRAEVATLEAEVASAQARIARRRAAVDRARLALEHTFLRMPFDGVVDAVHVEVGDRARVGEVGVVVADDARLEVRLPVRSAVAAGLSRGQPVRLWLEGQARQGEVVAVQAVPDPRSWTREVVVRLSPGVGVLGEWVEVDLPLPALQAVLAVPVTALLRDEAGVWVFRVEGDRLVRVRVETGERVGDWQVLRAGVAAGDVVVARDVAALADGQRVEVTR